jgi:hypothetical protein
VTAPRCPFQTAIIAQDFACSLGESVTARNTPEIHCRSVQALGVCSRLYEHLKKVGLPAFGMDDDLARTPHNIYQRIQYGGLLGLQAQSGVASPGEVRIEDLHRLVSLATAGGTRIDALDYASLVPHMQEQQGRRRRERRRPDRS